jgi:predicted nucleotide-binding protein
MDALTRVNQLVAIPNPKGADDPQFVKWRLNCLRAIAQIDGEESSTLRTFEEIDFEGNELGGMGYEQDYQKNFHDCFAKSIAILQSVQDSIHEEINLEFQRSASTKPNQDSTVMRSPTNKQVFVVHGHDEQLKAQVARFLEKLDLQPIILHEQPDQGQTIIEKFEKHSEVSFAVVLLTPDDEGRNGKSPKPHWSDVFSIEEPPMMPRARQNVILEFGYFLGKLGRPKVCALYCEGVELPSDYDGVLYTKVDSDGAWRLKLFKELKAAGFPVDANRLT